MGIFFEDINYSADGGLYAELIQNRDFEYDPSDREGDKNWNSTHSWKLEGEKRHLYRIDFGPYPSEQPALCRLEDEPAGSCPDQHRF